MTEPENSRAKVPSDGGSGSRPQTAQAATGRGIGGRQEYRVSAGELQGDAALQTSQRRLALAQQALGFGIWDWDLVRQTIDWSPEMYVILGLDPVGRRS